MQGQAGGAPTWSVVVHWVCWPWGFPGGTGQDQPPPVSCPEPPCLNYKQSEMTAPCGGLGDFQVKPSCESRLLVLGLGLTEASCCLFERI